ncbi:MAG: N-acetylmuramoyl-L-alanine amidase, partial [Oscillochloris sp.]|nr:N-acetylmuramoyl-L-alanine amidase [Oscillochloris sp.]
MSNDAVEIENVGSPKKAGETREGKPVELIVLVDTGSSGDEVSGRLPNYHIDQMGSIRLFVDESRAGEVFDLAIYRKRRYNINRIAISILLERFREGDYSDDQVAALSRLVAEITARHKLGDEALVRLLPDAEGKLRVTPSLPPAPSIVSGDLLGTAPLSPEQDLWLLLYGESYKPRSGTLKIGQAMPLHAAKFKLGAPIGPNDATTTVSVEGHTYSVQPFATDLIFYEGTQYAAVQSMNHMFDDDAAEIPATGTARALLEAYYRISIATTEKRTGALKHTKTLQPDWRFHLVAKNGHLGPALSDNYIFKADQDYAFQVFGADTLYTPMSDQAGCEHLNLT